MLNANVETAVRDLSSDLETPSEPVAKVPGETFSLLRTAGRVVSTIELCLLFNGLRHAAEVFNSKLNYWSPFWGVEVLGFRVPWRVSWAVEAPLDDLVWLLIPFAFQLGPHSEKFGPQEVPKWGAFRV